MNRKTIYIDTGANINALTATAGMIVYCTATGSGFTIDHVYVRNNANNTWNDLGALNIVIGDSIMVYPYDQTIGDYTTPTLASSVRSLASIAGVGSLTGLDTLVWVRKFTGLVVGQNISQVGLSITVSSGNIRVKVYKDDGAGGDPSTLLAESGSVASPGTGKQYITLTTDAIVPASGNVWVGFETDSVTFGLDQTSGVSGTSKSVVHIYGAGPSPFGTVTNQVYGFYMEIRQDSGGTSANAVDNNTATKWTSSSVINPSIYVDMNAIGNLIEIAIYYDSGLTTATQFEIDTSPDAITWTKVRTVNTSLLTNAAWNYIRWNPPNTGQPRYVRIYGTDATAKVLSIWEIKILNPTTWQLNILHGHKPIANNDGTLVLST